MEGIMKVIKTIDPQNKRQRTEKEKLLQRYKHIFWIVLLASVFFAGHFTGSNDQWWEGYNLGQDVMASQSKKIRDKMNNPELSPFYLADIGIYFTPRGNRIVTLRFLDTGKPTAKVLAGLEKDKEGP
jgi:hypothetical protein